jgi:hypothetical protein
MRLAVGQEAVQLPQEIQVRKVSVSAATCAANEESMCSLVQQRDSDMFSVSVARLFRYDFYFTRNERTVKEEPNMTFPWPGRTHEARGSAGDRRCRNAAPWRIRNNSVGVMSLLFR